MNPGRKDKGFSTAGVVKLTQISDHPEAPKFRLWFERAVMFDLNRKKEMRETHRSPSARCAGALRFVNLHPPAAKKSPVCRPWHMRA